MTSGGNNFNYSTNNKLTKLANLVQLKRMPMFCLEDWSAARHPGTLLSTPMTTQHALQRTRSMTVITMNRDKDAACIRHGTYHQF